MTPRAVPRLPSSVSCVGTGPWLNGTRVPLELDAAWRETSSVSTAVSSLPLCHQQGPVADTHSAASLDSRASDSMCEATQQ